MSRLNLTYTISKEECEQFAMLLDKGLDSRSLIELCFSTSKEILQDLEKGESLHQILATHTKGMRLLYVFKDKLSLHQCFKCIRDLEQFWKQFQKVIFKKGMYPFCIFLFGYCILFFTQYIIPQIEFFIHSDSVLYFMLALKIVYTLLLVGFVFLFFFLYMLSNLKIEWMEAWVRWIPLFKKISSYQFAIVYKTLIRQRFLSYECFD